MPYSLAKAQILMDRAVWAPRENRDKIIEVAKLYKITKNFSYREARTMVDKLTMPSLVFKTILELEWTSSIKTSCPNTATRPNTPKMLYGH